MAATGTLIRKSLTKQVVAAPASSTPGLTLPASPIPKPKGLLDLLKDVWDFMVSNLKHYFLSFVFVLTLYGLQSLLYPKEYAIDAMLESGTRPTVLTSHVNINRPEIELIKRFIYQNQTNLFGVVLGPSGAGKTYLTRLACNDSGVLYYEIADPSLFPERLARKIGMKLVGDTNFIDILVEKVWGTSFINFYRLPQELPLAMSFVLDTLAERGSIFRKNHNRIPCLFIDGVDLLAKKYREEFLTLVDLAKHYANNGMLRIVMVSRDGWIVPLLDSTPSQILGDSVEIQDIDKEDAVHYLTQTGMSNDLSERVFNFTGGRFSLLNQAINIYGKQNKFSEDGVFYSINRSLTSMCYGKKINVYEEAEIILFIVLQLNGTIFPEVFQVFGMDKAVYSKALFGLIELNLLRYTGGDNITWHNQVVHNTFVTRQRMYKYFKDHNMTSS